MGLPVPGIFLYREPKTNRHLVVDGQQRLRTIQYFYEGTFLERKFRLVGVRSEWNNKSYSDLSPADQLKLDDSTIHATIFQQDEPKDSQRSLYFVFERINSGGIRLSPQEIRNCINDGPLLDRIREINEDLYWRAIFGEKRNARLKDQELILRFFAMMVRPDTYSQPMRDFLNQFTADFENADRQVLDGFKAMFAETVKAIWDAKGRSAFRPIRALNAAVFEGVMVGLATRLKIDPKPATAEISAAYDRLLQDAAFLRACERATAVEESVRTRRTRAVAAFAAAA